ncbi:pallilysin-related adhesin [Spirochaeta cellobiosiphila]|uniref:pallilysin-related adhesin n=1 Tax=Spirochaeta cellobiosiphila TaxID=504483 RepID=UPI00048A4EDC|nr:pallilysin-related adhesin [Spirochaeta cellobiosiphila]
MRSTILIFLITILMACSQNSQTDDQNDLNNNTITTDIDNIEDSPVLIDNDNDNLLPSDESILLSYSVNLDLDPYEEQVKITIKPSRHDTPIKLWVIDYDNVRQKSQISYSSYLAATSKDDITVEFEDLLGDFSLEIIARGTSTNSTRTMDVWKKNSNASPSTDYSKIFTITTEGSINIDRKERSKGYTEGQKPGISFPIEILEKANKEADNFDLMKRTYYWRYNQDKYALSKEEQLSGQQIEAQHLKELYRANATEYMTYLSGIWVNPNTNRQIFIDNTSNGISFIGDSLQEIYSINRKYKGIYNLIELYGDNELLSNVQKYITVSLNDLNSITMKVEEIDGWKRTPDEVWSGMYQRPDTKPAPIDQLPHPSGSYSNSLGLQIFFDFPHFSMTQNNHDTVTGIANIFKLNDDLVLQLKEIKQNGTEGVQFAYKLKYEESSDKYKEIRTIILQEGNLTTSGMKLYDDTPLRLEQIEIFGELR